MDEALMRVGLQHVVRAVGALAAVWASPLAAQTVRGTVVDSATSQTLVAVSIELRGADSQVVARVLSDGAGAFLLRAPDTGAYRVRVQRIGYRRFDSPMILSADGETVVTLRLIAVPVQLAPVSVEAAKHAYLEHRGFYARKQSERGTFLDPETVDKLASEARVATDILVRIPSVRISQGAPQLRTCRNLGPRGRGSNPGATRIFVDGVESGEEIMWIMQPHDILAVEVYMGAAQTPLAFGGRNTPCGAILIWTKR